MIRSFSSVVFSTLTMTLNQSVPAHQRATMNGLSMLGGSLAKGFGPVFGGILFSTSVGHIHPPFGSVFVYCIISFLGICLGLRVVFFLKEELHDHPQHHHHHHNNEKPSFNKIRTDRKLQTKKNDDEP